MGRGEATSRLSVPSRWEQARTAAETHEPKRRRTLRPTAPGLMGPALQGEEACPHPCLPKKALENPLLQPPLLPSDPPKELKAPFPSSVRFLDCPAVSRAEARKGFEPQSQHCLLEFFL